MKHLSTYRIFESYSDDIKSDLDDIILDINDDVYWKAMSFHSGIDDIDKWSILINIEDNDHEYEAEGKSPDDNILECIKRSIRYMKSKGYDIFEIHVGDTNAGPDGEEGFDRVYIVDIKELDIWSNNFIRIDFTRDETPKVLEYNLFSQTSSNQYVDDILVNLNDVGFVTKVVNSPTKGRT